MPSSASRPTTDLVSSRTSRDAAGWGCSHRADPSALYRPDRVRPGKKRRQFSWISPRPLWDSRNDRLARRLGDSTDYERTRWVEARRRAGFDVNVPITRHAGKDEVSFMVLGDPGEGDHSMDWNNPPPPLFKSFLRIDTRAGEIEIRCFATGSEEHADNPPLEDHIKGNSRWRRAVDLGVLLD